MSELKRGEGLYIKKIVKIAVLAIFIFVFLVIAANQYVLAEGNFSKKIFAQMSPAGPPNSPRPGSPGNPVSPESPGQNNNLNSEEARRQMEDARLAEEKIKLAEAKTAEEIRNRQELEGAKRLAGEEARLTQAVKLKAENNAKLAEAAKRNADKSAKLAEENKRKQLEQARLAEIENKKNIRNDNGQAVTIEDKRRAEERQNLIQLERRRVEEQAIEAERQAMRAQEDFDRANMDVQRADAEAENAEALVRRVNNVNEDNLRELQNISKSTGIELIDESIADPAASADSGLVIKQLIGRSMVMRPGPLLPREAPRPEMIMSDINRGVILAPTDREISIFNNNNPLAETDRPIGLTILASIERENKNQANLSPVIMVLDSDGDGLSDDMEKRIGTDTQNADTDGDGYSDYIEIKNNYNPLGKGKHDVNMKPVEKAIINRTAIEQPRSSVMAVNKNLMIQRIITGRGRIIARAETAEIASSSPVGDMTTTQDEKLKFEGVATPDEVVLLFIYSEMPIVVTMNTDKNGNWVYDLDKTLVSGNHEAYVVVMNEKGQIKSKSSPLAFFVKEVESATISEADAASSNSTSVGSGTPSNFNFSS